MACDTKKLISYNLTYFGLIGGFALTAQQDPVISVIGGVVTIGSFDSMLFGDGIAMAIDYQLDPLERRARKFAKERNAEPEWQNVITIQHKNRLVRAIHGIVDHFLQV